MSCPKTQNCYKTIPEFLSPYRRFVGNWCSQVRFWNLSVCIFISLSDLNISLDFVCRKRYTTLVSSVWTRQRVVMPCGKKCCILIENVSLVCDSDSCSSRIDYNVLEVVPVICNHWLFTLLTTGRILSHLSLFILPDVRRHGIKVFLMPRSQILFCWGEFSFALLASWAFYGGPSGYELTVSPSVDDCCLVELVSGGPSGPGFVLCSTQIPSVGQSSVLWRSFCGRELAPWP